MKLLLTFWKFFMKKHQKHWCRPWHRKCGYCLLWWKVRPFTEKKVAVFILDNFGWWKTVERYKKCARNILFSNKIILFCHWFSRRGKTLSHLFCNYALSKYLVEPSKLAPAASGGDSHTKLVGVLFDPHDGCFIFPLSAS